MAWPPDVVLRRFLPPKVLRPLIKLAKPAGPWLGPPVTGVPTGPVAPGATGWPSSSVTKKVAHMLGGSVILLKQTS